MSVVVNEFAAPYYVILFHIQTCVRRRVDEEKNCMICLYSHIYQKVYTKWWEGSFLCHLPAISNFFFLFKETDDNTQFIHYAQHTLGLFLIFSLKTASVYQRSYKQCHSAISCLRQEFVNSKCSHFLKHSFIM